jgi:hypothetical protein
VESSYREWWDEELRGRRVRESLEAQGEEVRGEELGVSPPRKDVVFSGACAHVDTVEAARFELVVSRRCTARPGQRGSPMALVPPVEGVAEQGEEGSPVGMMSGAVASRQVHDNVVLHARVVRGRGEEKAGEGRRGDTDIERDPREGEEERPMRHSGGRRCGAEGRTSWDGGGVRKALSARKGGDDLAPVLLLQAHAVLLVGAQV